MDGSTLGDLPTLDGRSRAAAGLDRVGRAEASGLQSLNLEGHWRGHGVEPRPESAFHARVLTDDVPYELREGRLPLPG